jgi:hypothetical protein
MELNDYVMDQEMRRRRRMLNDPANADVSAEFVEGGGLDLGGGLLSSNMMEPAPNQTGLMEPATHQTTPMDPNAHTRPAGAVYDEPDQNLKSVLAAQYEKQILDEALNAEEWEKERIRLVKEDNKLAMLVSLVTGQPYKPMSIQSDIATGTAAASANTRKKKVQLEKATIDSRMAENPPRTLDELIEFGTSMGLTPEGWTHLKNRGPLYDWGKVVEWRKLNPDSGEVLISQSREGNEARNDELRDDGYTTKGLGEQRGDRVAKMHLKVTNALMEVTGGLGVQALDKENYAKLERNYSELFTDQFAIPAINQLKQHLKIEAKKVLMVGDQGTKVVDNNEKTIRAAEQDGWVKADTKNLTSLRDSKLRTALVSDVATELEVIKPFAASNPELFKQAILERLRVKLAGEEYASLSNANIATLEKMVLGVMGEGTNRISSQAKLFDWYRSEILSNTDLSEREMLSALRDGAPIEVDGKTIHIKPNKQQSELLSKETADAHKLGPRPIPEDSGIFTLDSHGNTQMITARRMKVRTLDGKIKDLKDEKAPWPTSDGGKKLWAPLYQMVVDDTTGDHVYAEIEGSSQWTPTDKWNEPVIARLRKNITTPLGSPTQFNDAVESYHGLIESFSMLGELGEDITTGNIDKQIGTLIIKLRDTSMVTEGEFQALQRSAGWLDSLTNITEEYLEGAEFTPEQRTTMLLLIDGWVRGKMRRAQDKVEEQRNLLTRHLAGSVYDATGGSRTMGDMDDKINDLMLDAGVPLQVLSGEFLRSIRDVIGRNRDGMFKPIGEIEGLARPDSNNTQETWKQRKARMDREKSGGGSSTGITARDLLN